MAVDELEALAEHSISSSEARFKEVCSTFEQAVRLEIMFWEMVSIAIYLLFKSDLNKYFKMPAH
ncbi:hypothetical protein CU097_011873 [Rhizopus azygosporus]|uniref:Uncharacterized protein n=1 Tax=Rhizopus azygosporus TaxID=86630 RepID=A0A367KG97_RHIAZ|nr:hypothetical protein CU097_011873 [Rhizopus azygosporus]